MSSPGSLTEFAQGQGIDLVVVDVGSAGFFQSDLGQLQPISTMVGFDPDVRETVEPASGFRRAVLVPKAVAPSASGKVRFFLTKNPLCSSLLAPNTKALGSFEFQEMFEVEREVEVDATDLNAVISDYGLWQIDWLKVDAQGADLKLLKGMSPANLQALTCVEVEPGLIDAYNGEDLFPKVHEWMTAQGFWLENIFVQHYGRYSKHALARIPEGQIEAFKKVCHRSPTAVEVRYLRTLDYLSSDQRPRRQLIAAALLGLHLGQLGYALEVAEVMQKRFADDKFLQDVIRLVGDSVDQKQRARYAMGRRVLPGFLRKARSLIGKLAEGRGRA